MKKFLYTFLLLVASFSVSAQGYQSTQIGLVEGVSGAYLSYPTTTLSVELLVEKEVVTPGVYARYTQKYLALRAPLVAQTSYSIVGGCVNIVENLSMPTVEPKATKVEYSTLPVDQCSSAILSDDNAARAAAEAIFTIRRQRRDIINGEAGEGYFGAGLADAMARMDKMENEYLELFLGSRTISQSVERYIFNPQEDASRCVIARFDPREGVMSANELSGSPIYLEFAVQEMPNTDSLAPIEKSKNRIWFRFAAPTQCTLFNDSQIIATALLPIYEFGKTVEVDPNVNDRIVEFPKSSKKSKR